MVLFEFSWVWLGWVFHITSSFLVAWHCLQNRREPTSTWLWIFVSWLLPAAGPLLYVSIGIDRVADKGFQKLETDMHFLAERRAREDEALPLAYWRTVHQSVAAEPDDPPLRDLNRLLNAVLPEHPALGGNEVLPLVDGDEAFPRMLDAISRARHHVHLQSFIIRDDSTGRQFLSALAERARAGVRVRILYDRFGCTHAVYTGFFRRFRHIPNLTVAGWTQANPLKRQFQVNLRNHRKVLVIDGREAFCGGINIHEENVGRPGRAAIRDYHFLLRGPVVQELQFTFMRDWYHMTDEDPESLLQEVYFPPIQPTGSAIIRLANSGPTFLEWEAAAEVYFACLMRARKQVLVVTPYFVPPRDIVRVLRTAALGGADVRLLVPGRNNHVYAGLAAQAQYEELLTSGVRIFERRPPFMHAKAMILDSAMAIVGTANLDVRSLRLNYETNLVIYDDVFVNRMKAIVLNDFAHSDEILPGEWRMRPVAHRVVENLAYLMMPVL